MMNKMSRFIDKTTASKGTDKVCDAVATPGTLRVSHWTKMEKKLGDLL